MTNLSEIGDASAGPTVQAGTVPSEPAARQVVIFVDALSTDTFGRKRACTAIAAFLRQLRPADEVMLVMWNRHLTITVPATRDRAAVEKGLTQAAREVSAGRLASLMRERTQSSGSAEARVQRRVQARMIADDLAATANAINGVLTKMAAVDGRKILLLLSEGFPVRRERSEELPEDDELKDVDVLASVARHANAAGVTLYTMHTRGLDSGMSVEDSNPNLAASRVAGMSSSIDGLTYLANQTGGLVAANTNTFQRSMERIASDLSSYYSLGYRARAERKDGERKVEIRTRDRNLNVRARRTFVQRSFESEISDRVVSNLFFPAGGNELGIALNAAASVKQQKDRVKIPVDVLIPMVGLTFSPDGDGYAADLTVFIASSEPKGGMSAVETFRRRVNVKREDLPRLATKHYTYALDVDLRTGSAENRIAVAVLDNLSKATGFAVTNVKTNGRGTPTERR